MRKSRATQLLHIDIFSSHQVIHTVSTRALCHMFCNTTCHCCGRHQWQRRQPGGPGMSYVGVPSSISLSFGVASMLHQNPRCSCNGSRPIKSSSRLLRTRAIHKLRNLWQCLHLCLRDFKFWLFCWRCCAVERLHDFVSQCQCSIVTHARMFYAW